MHHCGGDGEGRGGTMDATYQATYNKEPIQCCSPACGAVNFRFQSSLLCAMCRELSTGEAEMPRAKKRRAAGNLIGNIIIVHGSKQEAKRNVESARVCERWTMRYDVRTRKWLGVPAPLDTRKKGWAAVQRAACSRMNPHAKHRCHLRSSRVYKYWCAPANPHHQENYI
jgi:uncharacterized Zn finger protein (UPF0148 family)